jgi:hypothetical protein
MMYWRIRKYGVAEMFQQYGLHLAVLISVLLNIFLIATRPGPNKGVSTEVKTDFEQFGRRVTQHILDTSYINYQSATTSLMDPQSGELAPPVVNIMRKRGLLPNSKEELQASIKAFGDSKRVCAVNVQTVRVSDPDSQGLIPIDVTGVVAVHSAEESYPGPVPFHFRYRVGYRRGSTTPLVSDFADLSH